MVVRTNRSLHDNKLKEDLEEEYAKTSEEARCVKRLQLLKESLAYEKGMDQHRVMNMQMMGKKKDIKSCGAR